MLSSTVITEKAAAPRKTAGFRASLTSSTVLVICKMSGVNAVPSKKPSTSPTGMPNPHITSA